jgi:hypothetical protein
MLVIFGEAPARRVVNSALAARLLLVTSFKLR